MGPRMLRAAQGVDWLSTAAAHLRAGKILAVPTETVYGLCVSAFNRAGVEALFHLKSRYEMKPLPIQVDSIRTALVAGFLFPDRVLALAETFWPGPLTIVVPRPPTIPSWYAPDSHEVALRIPNHAVTLALLDEMGAPLAITSANLSGEPPLTDAPSIARTFQNAVDLLILDDGPSPGGLASTVVDVTGERPSLVREGPIPLSSILEVWDGRA